MLARLFALRDRLLGPVLVAAASLLTAAPAWAQGRPAYGGNDTLGGTQNYWGDLFGDLAVTLCPPIRLTMRLGLAAGGVILMWLIFQASRGDSRKWKAAFILAIALSIMVSPDSFFSLVGLEDMVRMNHGTGAGFTLYRMMGLGGIGGSCPTP